MKKTAIGLITALLIVFLPACNQSGFGIFYSIASEEPLANRDLDDSLTVIDIVLADGDYYMAAGALYTLDTADSESQWTVVDPPVPGHLCSGLAADGSDLYAIFYAPDGSESSLYRRNFVSGTWEDVTEFSGLRVESVVSANTYVFVSVKTGSNSYDLYSNVLDAFDIDGDAEGDVTGNPRPFVDVAFDTTDYWITDGTSILTGTEDAWTLDEPAASGTPTGLFYSSLYGQLYAAFESSEAEASEVFVHDGAAWGGTADTSQLLAPTDFSEINRGGKDIVILGSVSGYYETDTGSGFSEPDPANELTTNQNYLNIELEDSIIRCLFVNGDTIFAGTVGNGLWKNVAGVWSRE